MKELRDYQTHAINELARKASQGLTRLIFQLATGGGKTVSFAGLIHRYLQRNKRKVLILVHRAELLQQARRTLYDWYGIIAEPITQGVRHLPPGDVYVAMVETANNRIKRNPKYFGDVGLMIVDEAHIGNFKKMYEHFPNTLIVGFTATPISSSKKDPLKNHFEDIVTGIDIPDLIASRSLVPNKTYHVKNIKRSELKIKNGEFDETYMADLMMKPKHVENCVQGYEKHCAGQKTLVFNCNVEHSKMVKDAFILHGYEARHLDATSKDRAEVLEWFKSTPNAILCNVGILTTGFDEPSVLCVVVNKSTLSLPLWLQMTGRGSRPFAGKKHFTIVDMGGNAIYHGDWCSTRDWADIFHNPDKPGGGGVAPVKECCGCGALIHASARVCPYCAADNSAAPVYDDELVEFELLTEARPLELKVEEVVEQVASSGQKEYSALHQIKTKVIGQARSQWGLRQLSDNHAYKLLDIYQEKVKEWCKAKGKKYNQWHKDITTQWFFDELKRVFKWEPQKMEIAI
jgi:superfamily II DNA or RNA helicase